MDNDEHFKPKHRKLDRHFVIFVNDRKVKILSYKVYSHWDSLDEQEYQVIEIVTKISNENLNYKRVNITIEKEDSVIEIIGLFYGVLFQPGLSRYKFKIESYVQKGKDS